MLQMATPADINRFGNARSSSVMTKRVEAEVRLSFDGKRNKSELAMQSVKRFKFGTTSLYEQ